MSESTSCARAHQSPTDRPPNHPTAASTTTPRSASRARRDAPSVWQSALAMTLRRTSPACGGATRIFSVTSGSLAAHATAARHSIGLPSNSDAMVAGWLTWLEMLPVGGVGGCILDGVRGGERAAGSVGRPLLLSRLSARGRNRCSGARTPRGDARSVHAFGRLVPRAEAESEQKGGASSFIDRSTNRPNMHVNVRRSVIAAAHRVAHAVQAGRRGRGDGRVLPPHNPLWSDGAMLLLCGTVKNCSGACQHGRPSPH